jgi:predicted transcriptional regulator
MSFEQPKQGREELKGVAERIASISEQLAKRKTEGQNNLFGPDSEVFFESLSQRLQQVEGDDFSQIAEEFENEIHKFGKHAGETVIDNLDSLAETSRMFAELSKEFTSLNTSSNSNLERMSELSQSVSDVLEQKRKILDEYLNR